MVAGSIQLVYGPKIPHESAIISAVLLHIAFPKKVVWQEETPDSETALQNYVKLVP